MNNVGLITISGITTVFIVLLLLMVIYYLFGYFSNNNQKQNKKVNLPSPKKMESKPVQIQREEKKEDNDEEIAAITAAVYSFIDSSKYRIKNIKKSTVNNKKQRISRWGSVPPANTWRTNR